MLNSKKSITKPFLENVSVWGKYIQNFLAPNFDIFKRIFSDKVKFEANRKTKMILGGSGCMLPRKIFKNSHTVNF